MNRPGTRFFFILPGLLFVMVGGLFLTACAATPAPTRARLLQRSPASPSAPSTVPTAPAGSSSVAQSEPPSRDPAASGGVGQEQATTFASTATPLLPTSTPFPEPRLRQLTSGSCCTQPFWSADSRQVQFIDRPASRPLGIYGVDVERLGPPTLVTEWIVNTSGDGAFFVYPDGATTIVQRAATGEKYVVANGGRAVDVSPGGQWLLWQVMEQRGDFDRRRSQIWVANVDGSDARVVAETVGYSWSQWIDDRRILLVGLPLEDLPFVTIAALTLGPEESSDQLVELARVARPRGTSISPEGNWLVYYLTFQSNPDDDGLWVVPTDGSRPPRKLDFFGSWRFRDDMHLLYAPLEPGVESHTLWEYDLLSGERQRLTDPAETPFKIANGDWSCSPNGRYVVFVNAADHNLWLMDLEP
jgi:hypothetical protein